MNKDKMEIVLVLGYGCHLNENYQIYLRRVVQYAILNPMVTKIVTCGGASQKKTAPGSTEAEVMRDYLIEQFSVIGQPCVIVPDIDVEKISLTTRENLYFARQYINATFDDPDKYQIVIFCDAVRALKVKILALDIFYDYEVRIETYDLSSQKESKQQLYASFLEALSLKFRSLAYWHSNRRIKQSERI